LDFRRDEGPELVGDLGVLGDELLRIERLAPVDLLEIIVQRRVDSGIVRFGRL
jgi:hypothetical protein